MNRADYERDADRAWEVYNAAWEKNWGFVPMSHDEFKHMSGMLNTAEVASEMYISVNTVKSHLKSIYRKLAAAHRGEAVRRARQLELI